MRPKSQGQARPQSQGAKAFKYNGHSQGRIEEFNKGEAVTAVDESPAKKIFSPPDYCM